MAFQVAHNLRFRRSFGRIKKIIDLPYLIEIQKNSYDVFLQKDVAPDQRQSSGLQGVFKSVFPIKDFNETASLEYVSYTLGEPKYDVDECHQRGMTFAAPLKVTVQLVLWDVDQQSQSRSIKNVKEQEVYFGEMPLMTKNGTFMVNGTERVIVSQLHRSPGVFFEHDKGKTHASGKLLYSARVIPYRGSWLDFEFDPRDILYVRIDRRRKMPVTILLKAIGLTPESILANFFVFDNFRLMDSGAQMEFVADRLRGEIARFDITDKDGNVVVEKDKRITARHTRELEQSNTTHISVPEDYLMGRMLARNVVDADSGEILAKANDELTESLLKKLRVAGVKEIQAIYTNEL